MQGQFVDLMAAADFLGPGAVEARRGRRAPARAARPVAAGSTVTAGSREAHGTGDHLPW